MAIELNAKVGTDIREVLEEINALPVDFQACMFPDKKRERRDKWTRLFTNNKEFLTLSRKCDGKHEHAPWGQVQKDGELTWATSLECEYTKNLCNEIAQAATNMATDHTLPTPPPRKVRRPTAQNEELTATRASCGRQTKRNFWTNIPERKRKEMLYTTASKRMKLPEGKVEEDIAVNEHNIPKVSFIHNLAVTSKNIVSTR